MIIPNMVNKTMEQHVFITLIEATWVIVAFDL
jgi:hypothetical protein